MVGQELISKLEPGPCAAVGPAALRQTGAACADGGPEQAGLERRTRPDRAEALTRAAEYDRWVRAKVEASRADPRPAIAEDEWQRIRAAKLAERKAILGDKAA